MGKKTKIAIGAGVLVLLWHFILSVGISGDSSAIPEADGVDVSMSTNWLTNVVTITVHQDPMASDLERSMTAGFTQLMVPGLLERALNQRARSLGNLYAILIPYSVRVVEGEPTEESLARAEQRRAELAAEEAEREEAEAQAAAEEEAQRQERLEYALRYVNIENGRVSEGQRFGQTVPGVFGTLVNTGPRDLSKVEVTVYFLDAAGKRIGEEDYYPIWTENMFNATKPLRSGYREDFGYRVDETAPSGWAERVQFEITDIEFLE